MDSFYPRFERSYGNRHLFLEEYPPGINIRRLFGDAGNYYYFDPWRRNEIFAQSPCKCRNCSYSKLRRPSNKKISAPRQPFLTKGQHHDDEEFLAAAEEEDIDKHHDDCCDERYLPSKNVLNHNLRYNEDEEDDHIIIESNDEKADNNNVNYDDVIQSEDVDNDDDSVMNKKTTSTDDINVSDYGYNELLEETENLDTTMTESISVEDDKQTVSVMTPPEQQKKLVIDKLELIRSVQEKVNKLAEKVENLTGKARTKDHLFCEEMLMKCMLELDSVLAEGEEIVRKARKAVISYINENISKLENISEHVHNL